MADVRDHTCPPGTYTTHSLNPKALQGSVSSRARNSSWGNPRGSSTPPPTLALKSYWIGNCREQLHHGWREDGGACFAGAAVCCCCPCGQSEEGRGRTSDTGAFCDSDAPAVSAQTHSICTHPQEGLAARSDYSTLHTTLYVHQSQRRGGNKFNGEIFSFTGAFCKRSNQCQADLRCSFNQERHCELRRGSWHGAGL